MSTVPAPGVECPGVEARLDPGLHRRMVPAPPPVTGVTPLTGMFPLNTDTGRLRDVESLFKKILTLESMYNWVPQSMECGYWILDSMERRLLTPGFHRLH